MTPYYLGPRDQQIYCSLHLPDTGASPKRAVLFCNPFGQEAIRTHRFFRVLADRFTRQGFAVMRFEYYGTGDSAGRDDEADLNRWSRDALAAHAELQRKTGLTDVLWLGARLGCNVALQALQAAGMRASKLVLWDPVTDGGAYLQMLRDEHMARMQIVFRRPDTPWAAWQQPDERMQEASGFPIGDTMREQIGAIRLTLDGMRAREYAVVRDPQDPVLQPWAEQAKANANVNVVDLPATFSWTEHEARDGTVVPGQALQTLLRTLGD